MDEVKKYSLLIVDDRASNIIALANILKPEYTIYVSKNGPDALRVASEKLPDIILLDVVMPGMDGYEVIAALKGDARTREIPVIFITSMDSANDEEKGLTLKAADYITKPFSPVNIRLRVRNHIQIISQMRTVEEMSLTDKLTGIPNRRSFDARLDIEWSKAVREQLPITLLMVDVDNFKIYNDTYGHQQGDAALQTVAQSFSRSVRRATDFFARWGGEEFAVLLTNVEYADALNLAESIRNEAAVSVIPGTSGGGSHITVRIGFNICVPTAKNLIADFIAGADASLYAAKLAGRNRVGAGK